MIISANHGTPGKVFLPVLMCHLRAKPVKRQMVEKILVFQEEAICAKKGKTGSKLRASNYFRQAWTSAFNLLNATVICFRA
jgi:hypothetical protein